MNARLGEELNACCLFLLWGGLFSHFLSSWTLPTFLEDHLNGIHQVYTFLAHDSGREFLFEGLSLFHASATP